MRIVRLIAVSLLLLIGTLWQSAPAHALAPRPLTDGDFFNASVGTGVVGDLSIDGEHYKGGLAVPFNGVYDNPARVSIAAHALVGYNAMVFKAGFIDGSAGDTAQLQIYRDNRPYRTVILRNGTPALAVQILFGGARAIELSIGDNLYTTLALNSRRIGLAVPMAILATGRGVSLALGATSVQPGALLPIAVTTAPSAPVTLVISYPGGGQKVIGPTPAPASGRFTYALQVPATVHGTVRVVAVTGGVVSQATFTVG